MNLFVVEHSGSLGEKIEALLDEGIGENYIVTSFTTIEQALNAVNGSYKCVLLFDPETIQETTSSLLRRLRQHSSDVPALLVTSHSKESLALGAVDEGAQDYLLYERLTAERLIHSIRVSLRRIKSHQSFRKALSELEFALASEKVLLEELDRRNKELVALSITDGLTGLYNHRFIQERFDFEFKRAQRYKTNLSCMLIDIDNFKSINDSFGHQFGDLVLREIAQILRKNSREVDICGRYGGEEFMIITNLPVEGALMYAKKLRAAVEDYLFEVNGRKVGVTVSIGLAEFNVKIPHKQAMIRQADVALYQAKEDGKNLIRTWEEKMRRKCKSSHTVNVESQNEISVKEM